MKIPRACLFLAGTLFAAGTLSAATPIRTLIIDGQNNHDWKKTTPVLKQILESTGLFQVDVVTSPPKGGDFSTFRPEFAKYRLVVGNYNEFPTGDKWPEDVKTAFERFIDNGGGFVSYHAADNAFPEWPAYNLMIGIGGWLGRDEKSGPYWYFKDNKLVSDTTPGRAGNHGARTPFVVVTREPKHPIMRGLPEKWMHASDELYSRMRGPGKNMIVLATGWSDPANRGTGHDEPMLMALTYGKGRIFHTTLGHDPAAMACVGFITTLQRGAEWAATGKVTMKVPKDFPAADKESVRQ
ncbi:MAG: ThuA domain-containing protein [Acidobacteria bacterium]|nr:ThuA domain-containing protein [Acidobacteriota bacterium]